MQKKNSKKDYDDFYRLVIMYLFGTFFFANSTFCVHNNLIPLIMNVEVLNSYCWAQGIHFKLVEQLKKYHYNPRKMEACTIALLVKYKLNVF